MLARRRHTESEDGPTVRAIAPAIGVVLLLAVTACLAVTIVVAVGAVSPGESGPKAALDLSVDADEDRIVVEHVAGDRLNATDLSLRIAVEDEPIAHQPPIPFFAAEGFAGGPTGAFNPSGGTDLSAGESASLRVAATNEPSIDAGDTVTVEVVHDGRTIVTLEATAS